MFKNIKKATIEKVTEEIKQRTESITETLTEKITDVSETVQNKTDALSQSVGNLFDQETSGTPVSIEVQVENEVLEDIDTEYSQFEDDYIQKDLEEELIRMKESAEESRQYLEERRKKKKGRTIAAIAASAIVAVGGMNVASDHAQTASMEEHYDKAVSYIVAEEYDQALGELQDVTINDAEALAGYAYIQSSIEDYKGKPSSMLEDVQEIDSIENKDVKRQQELACKDIELADEIQTGIDSLDLSSVDSISRGEVKEIKKKTGNLNDRYKVLLSTDKYDLADRVLTNVDTKNEAGQVILGIDNLGDITLDSKDAIENLKAAYNDLSSSDKETILNYSALTAADSTYTKLRTEEDERIAAEKKAEEERIAAEKKAEEERKAAEKKAEEERLAAAAREAEQSGEMVWIPRTGSKYHRSSSCSNMKNPSQVTRSEAESMGFDPCKKCY